MAKICKSCGNYYTGEYCEKCGYGKPDIESKALNKYKKATVPERFQTPEQKAEYAKWDKEKHSHSNSDMKRHSDPKANVKVMIIALIVLVCVVIAVLYKSGMIFTSNKTDVVDKYFNSIQTGNFDDFVSCFPSEMSDEYKQQREDGGYSKDEVMNDVLYGDFKKSYGDDYTITVSYGKETKLTKDDYDMTEYKNAYGSVPSISEAYELVVNVTFKGSVGSEDAKLYIYVGKCSGSWKIFNITQDNGIVDETMTIKESSSSAE